MLDLCACAREDAARFDSSRLVDFAERLLWEGPAAQLTPLVREPGRLAVSDARLYFQPLHNVAGEKGGGRGVLVGGGWGRYGWWDGGACCCGSRGVCVMSSPLI
jgi:hypothetical protein